MSKLELYNHSKMTLVRIDLPQFFRAIYTSRSYVLFLTPATHKAHFTSPQRLLMHFTGEEVLH